MDFKDSTNLYILNLPESLPDNIDHEVELYEFTRLSQFKSEKRQKEFFWSRYLIYKVLNEHLNISYTKPLKYTDNGKPYLAGLDTHISITHSLGYIALAVSNGIELGLDIESADKDVSFNKIAGEYYSEQENQQILSCDEALQKDMFIRFWSLKEAVYKYFGLKMSKENVKIHFDLNGLKITEVPSLFSKTNLKIKNFKYNNYWMSLVTVEDQENLKIFDVTASFLNFNYQDITQSITTIELTSGY